MVIDRANGETVFDVFAKRVRVRSTRSLLHQVIAFTLAALLTVGLLPSWWPIGAAFTAAAGYAAWGLLDRQPPSRLTGLALRALVTLTALLVLIAVVGVGLAAFTGDGRSPYGTCYDANGRAFACNARGERR